MIGGIPNETIGLIVTVVIAIIAGVIRSATNGRIKAAVEQWRGRKREKEIRKRQEGKSIEHIVQTVDETYTRLDELDDSLECISDQLDDVNAAVQDTARVVALAHDRDKRINTEELRRRLNIEHLDTDLVKHDRKGKGEGGDKDRDRDFFRGGSKKRSSATFPGTPEDSDSDDDKPSKPPTGSKRSKQSDGVEGSEETRESTNSTDSDE